MSFKTLYLESVAGVAGDMFTASFIDAGLVSEDEIQTILSTLELSGVEIKIKKVLKASVKATHLDVVIVNEQWKKHFKSEKHSHAFVKNPNQPSHDEHWHSHYIQIDRFLEKSNLNSAVKDLSRAIFHQIALVESEAHGVSLEEVSFHEIGTVDSILDVVLAAFCVEKVGADTLFASPLRLGRGFVQIAHGTHPIPPPATIKLANGMPLAQTPNAIGRENVELTTPTGAAILKTLMLKKGLTFLAELPSGILKTQGSGAGTMDLGSFPNIFRVCLLEKTKTDSPFLTDEVCEIACNIDDETSEKMAWISERLLELGALDVWTISGTGKKGRVLHCLELLCEISKREELVSFLLFHSSTFGVRFKSWERKLLAREIKEIETRYGKVRVKFGKTLDGNIVKQKVEFEDFKRLLKDHPSLQVHDIFNK